MRFGRDGPALLKPEENGGLEPVDSGSTGEEGMEETMVVYDPLPPEEDIRKNRTNVNKN